ARRVTMRRDEYTPSEQKTLTKIAGLLGFNLKTIDIAKNMQWSWKDATKNFQDINRDLSSVKKNMMEMRIKKPGQTMSDAEKYPDEYAKKEEFRKTLAIQKAQANFDVMVMNALMKRRGLTPNEIMNKPREDIIRILTNQQKDPEFEKYIDEAASTVLQQAGQDLK
ncbi:MAG: hypothetical protein ACRDEA_21825, partial [Microcystaceae cyanobacterium]